MSPKLYTTGEAAEAVGITRATLQAWIAKGALRAPKHQVRNGVAVRLWTESNVAKLRDLKEEIFRKHWRPKKKKA